jgi:prepilin-type N-terminal cleavage/methylation domain-containing protein
MIIGAGEQTRCSHERQAGFTLIELLVSLMIVGLIISFIPGTLRLGQRVWETDRALEWSAGVSAFRRYVEHRLTEAIPIYLRDPDRGLFMEFSGGPERIRFVAPAAAGPAGGGVYRFELTHAAGSAGVRRVILRQSLYRTGHASTGGAQQQDPGFAPSTMTHVSPAPVTGVAFRYFGPSEPQQPPKWQTNWSNSDRLPDLVELTFILRGGASPQRSIVPLRLKRAP